MAKKTKANVQYTAEGTDKPAVGDFMVYNGSEFVPEKKSGLWLSIIGQSINLQHVSPYSFPDAWPQAPDIKFVSPITSGNITASWNNSTGKWTCPSAGHYRFDFAVTYIKSNNSDGWWHPVTGPGMMSIGVKYDSGVLVTGNSCSVVIPMQNIEISVSCFLYISTGQTVSFKVLNQTGYDFTQSQNSMHSILRVNIRRLL